MSARNHPLRVPRAALGLLVLLAALAAPGPAAAQASTARDASGVVDTVRIGCSGGVTGNGTGNVLTSDGRLSRYSKELQSPRVYTPLRQDSAAARAVFAELDRMRFRTVHHKEISNMTCVLELRDRAGEHYVSWPARNPPAALEPALAALRRAFGDDRAWY